MNIPQITEFQMRSLQDVAQSNCPYYFLVGPCELDTPEFRTRLENNNRETDELVALGMLENISLQFGPQAYQTKRESGRDLRAFQITLMGRLLFCASRPVTVH